MTCFSLNWSTLLASRKPPKYKQGRICVILHHISLLDSNNFFTFHSFFSLFVRHPALNISDNQNIIFKKQPEKNKHKHFKIKKITHHPLDAKNSRGHPWFQKVLWTCSVSWWLILIQKIAVSTSNYCINVMINQVI